MLYNLEKKRATSFRPNSIYFLSYAALASTRITLIHYKDTLTKKVERKLSQIRIISSSILPNDTNAFLSGIAKHKKKIHVFIVIDEPRSKPLPIVKH